MAEPASSVAGCTVFNLPAAGPIVAAGEVLTSGATRVATDGAGHALVVEGDPRGVNPLSRLVVVDLALGEAIGVLSGLDSVGALAADSDRSYVIEVGHGVRIVSVADPAAPRTIGFLTTFFLPQHVAAAGELLAVSDIFGTVQLLDAADPARVRVLAAIGAPPTDVDGGPLAIDIALRGGRLFIARHDRLAVFDVQEPRQPKALGEVLYDSTEGLSVAPNLGVGAERVWIASLQGGVIAFDARNPAAAPHRSLPGPGHRAHRRGRRAGDRAAGGPAGVRRGRDRRAAVVEAPWAAGRAASSASGRRQASPRSGPRPWPGSLGLLVASGPYGLTSWRLRAERAPRRRRPRPRRADRAAPDAHRRAAGRALAAPRLPAPRRPRRERRTARRGALARGRDGRRRDLGGDRRRYRLRRRSGPAGGAARAQRSRRVRAGSSPPATRPSASGRSRWPCRGGGWRRSSGLRGRCGRPRRPTRASAARSSPAAAARSRPNGPPATASRSACSTSTTPSGPGRRRVALPGGAIDLAAGDADLIGWFAAVGASADGGYIVLLDARTQPSRARSGSTWGRTSRRSGSR
ncbi:MAG: hypothetical protein U0470_02835 [Anaerolineae bacterium]